MIQKKTPMNSFFSPSPSPENKKASLTKSTIYAVVAIYVASSLMGQSSLFFKKALITVGETKIIDADIVTHIHLLPLDKKAEKKQKTYGHMIHKVSQLALLDQEVKKLGIRVSSQSAKESLAKNPVLDKASIKDFLSKHRITLSQAIHHEKRKLAHKRLKQAIRSQTAPIPQKVLSLWERGWCQHRKGIYRTFAITPQDIAAQKVSPSERSQYLEKSAIENSGMLSPAYRTCTVLALNTRDVRTKQYIQDLSKDNPDDLLKWAQKKGLHPHTLKIDSQGRGINKKAVSLPMMASYRSTYNDLFFQKERLGFAKNVFEHPVNTIFFHEVGQRQADYIVQVTEFIPSKTVSKADYEKRAVDAVRRNKAHAELQRKADDFAKSPSLQGMPITRFGFDILTVHDTASDDIFLYDSKASAPMNRAFPWVAKGLFDLEPGQCTARSIGIDALGNDVIYVIKATKVVNESPKNPLCNKDMQKRRSASQQRLEKEWAKRMWISYLSSLEKRYPIQYHQQQIQSFLHRISTPA